jgi:hypothetical protein
VKIYTTRKLRDWIGASDGDFDVSAEFYLVCNCIEVCQAYVVEIKFDAEGLVDYVVV